VAVTGFKVACGPFGYASLQAAAKDTSKETNTNTNAATPTKILSGRDNR
jgi:hypothetical protein